jgi:hypothetical protein
MVTQNIADLGKVRGETLRKAWHPCGNPPQGETDFYPLLAKVGKGLWLRQLLGSRAVVWWLIIDITCRVYSPPEDVIQ